MFSNKVVKRFALIVGGSFVLSIVIIVAFGGWFVWRVQSNIDQMQRPLLYQTNFPPVLAECDTLMARATTQPHDYFTLRQNDPAFPAIAALKSPYVYGTSKDVTIMFGGGFHHWFLRAYSPGTPQTGTKQLINRLWFEDVAGRVPDP